MFFYHPITLLAVQNVMTIFAIAYTQPYHPIRFAILPFILAYTYLLFPTFLHKLEYRVLASILCGTIFANLFTYLDRVILSQWSFENGGPVSPADLQIKQVLSRNKILGVAQDQAISPKHSKSFSANTFNRTLWQRLRYGYFISSAARLIGTPHQVKNVPAYWTSDPSRTPCPFEFLLRKLFIFCVCYFVLDVATSSADPVHNPVLYDPAKIPLFSRWAAVDSEELIRKMVGGMGYWTASYCTIQCYMGMWAFLCVACGDDPQYWRPNFGSLTKACTLRGFWGMFWHQHLRRSFVSISDSLVYSLLRLRKHTLIARYTHLVTVFLLSGILHTVTEVAAHCDPNDGTTMSFRDSQCIRFFLTQALGIMIEDGAQEAVRRVWPDGTQKETLKRVIGWVWVLGFLGWSTPAIMYPAASLNTGTRKDKLLPISIIQIIKYAKG